MKKSICFILLTLSFCFFANLPNYAYSKAEPSIGESPESIDITFSDNKVPFETSPLIIAGEIMVPSDKFLEYIKAQVYEMSEENLFVAYKDNTFIKFKEGSSLAYINGSKRLLTIAPFKYKDTLYIPFDLIAQSFGINYTFDTPKTTINADFRDPIHSYRVFGETYYKSITLNTMGISFYVPSAWSKLEGMPYRYGLLNDYQDYHIDFTPITIEGNTSRDSALNELKNGILEEHKEVVILEEKTYKSAHNLIDSFYFKTPNNGDYTDHVLYLILEGNSGYVFTGHFTEAKDGTEIKNMLDNIVATFQLNQITINNLQEHYVELMPFFTHNITFKTPIFSNMSVENQMILEGTLLKSDSIKGINVSVERNGQQMEMYIPVIEGTFKGTIFIPFGTGKHNITLALDGNVKEDSVVELLPPIDPDEDLYKAINRLNAYVEKAKKPSFAIDSENVFLKFSVINIASTATKDILPSKYINYDHADVYATANLITYNLTSEYAKAKAVYQWVYNHYQYSTQLSSEGIRSLEQLVKLNTANALELSAIQAGLMRSLNIPARIVRGQKSETTEFWVETYINGKWLISDIVLDVIEKPLIPSEVHYFNLNKKIHYGQYQTTEILPF